MNSFDENMTPRDRVDGIDSILRELMGDELLENPLPSPPPCQTGNDDRQEHHSTHGRGCEFLSLAMVISPYQEFDNLFDCYEEALQKGTLFRDLYMPMTGQGPCAYNGQNGGKCK
ncbi:MAG: spore coat associated protein CotJA [Clostridia bacterium]|nr:spore coat associated protein CotJA [Clostridia bacterium]MBR6795087.1 spore coat associated protein CotJA [Clostridia bacterium]